MKTTAAHAQAQTINSQNFAAGNAFGNSQVHSGGGQKLLRIVATPYLQVLLSLLISIFLVGLASFFFAEFSPVE